MLPAPSCADVVKRQPQRSLKSPLWEGYVGSTPTVRTIILSLSFAAPLPVLCFRRFACQFSIGDALAYYLRYCQRETV
jgi:hypothetical protein